MNSMSQLKHILVATNHLNSIGGTETFTYTLIEELKRRKFNVEYFTFNKGFVSNKIENELNVFFMKRKRYDVIFANHNTCVKKLFGKGVIIQTCHGIFPKLEKVSYLSDGVVSISNEIKIHNSKKGVKSKLILNGINCDRFDVVNKVNKELKSVLSLCQSELANKKLKRICDDLGINLLIANKHINPIWPIEKYINRVDIVVGLGRSAYCSMACGRPVIIWDERDYFESFGDGYIKNFIDLSILNNCSGRFFKKKFSESELKNEFFNYNYEDSEFYRDYALKNLNIRKNVDLYLDYLDNFYLVKLYWKLFNYNKMSILLLYTIKKYRSNFFLFIKNYQNKIC